MTFTLVTVSVDCMELNWLDVGVAEIVDTGDACISGLTFAEPPECDRKVFGFTRATSRPESVLVRPKCDEGITWACRSLRRGPMRPGETATAVGMGVGRHEQLGSRRVTRHRRAAWNNISKTKIWESLIVEDQLLQQ